MREASQVGFLLLTVLGAVSGETGNGGDDEQGSRFKAEVAGC